MQRAVGFYLLTSVQLFTRGKQSPRHELMCSLAWAQAAKRLPSFELERLDTNLERGAMLLSTSRGVRLRREMSAHGTTGSIKRSPGHLAEGHVSNPAYDRPLVLKGVYGS